MWTNIVITRSRISQNENNLIMKLTFHLNNRSIMTCVTIIMYYTDSGNTLTNTPNYLYLLRIVDMCHATLVQWTILLVMIFTTNLTLHRFPASGFILIPSRLRPMSFLSCIKLLMRCHLFLVTYIMMHSSLLRPFSFSLLIIFPFTLELRLALWLLRIML